MTLEISATFISRFRFTSLARKFLKLGCRRDNTHVHEGGEIKGDEAGIVEDFRICASKIVNQKLDWDKFLNYHASNSLRGRGDAQRRLVKLKMYEINGNAFEIMCMHRIKINDDSLQFLVAI